jgi:hypothetical protein
MKELLRGESTISLEAAVLKCPNAELYLYLSHFQAWYLLKNGFKMQFLCHKKQIFFHYEEEPIMIMKSLFIGGCNHVLWAEYRNTEYYRRYLVLQAASTKMRYSIRSA